MVFVPVLALAGCGSRQASQPAAGQAIDQTGTQPVAQPQPAAPQQPADEMGQPQTRPAPIVADVPRDSGVRAGSGATVPEPRQAQRQPITLPAGTVLHVRLEETLDTRRNRAGDSFVATVYDPVMVNGEAAVPRGARATGHLVESKPSGRLKGRAVMSLRLDTLELNGSRYAIRTASFTESSRRHRKRNLLIIGGGSGFGAAVGAIAGGPAGALIGAGAGAAAGTTGAALTGKKQVHVPVETRLAFALQAPVELP
jgi:hypothetical protein